MTDSDCNGFQRLNPLRMATSRRRFRRRLQPQWVGMLVLAGGNKGCSTSQTGTSWLADCYRQLSGQWAGSGDRFLTAMTGHPCARQTTFGTTGREVEQTSRDGMFKTK